MGHVIHHSTLAKNKGRSGAVLSQKEMARGWFDLLNFSSASHGGLLACFL